MGRDFGENLRVEWWNGGSRLKVREREELRDAELLVVVAVCQRSSTKSGVSRHRSRESLVESSEIVSKWRFVESRFAKWS